MLWSTLLLTHLHIFSLFKENLFYVSISKNANPNWTLKWNGRQKWKILSAFLSLSFYLMHQVEIEKVTSSSIIHVIVTCQRLFKAANLSSSIPVLVPLGCYYYYHPYWTEKREAEKFQVLLSRSRSY